MCIPAAVPTFCGFENFRTMGERGEGRSTRSYALCILYCVARIASRVSAPLECTATAAAAAAEVDQKPRLDR